MIDTRRLYMIAQTTAVCRERLLETEVPDMNRQRDVRRRRAQKTYRANTIHRLYGRMHSPLDTILLRKEMKRSEAAEKISRLCSSQKR